MKQTTKKKYTWADATEFGFAPDDVCDFCKKPFAQNPIQDQDRCGRHFVFCSYDCVNNFYKKHELLQGA
jgi:hypothetical protein